MSLILAILAPMLAQAGPLVSPGAAPPLRGTPEVEQRRPPRRAAEAPAPAPPPPSRLRSCLDEAEASPTDAIETAQNWLQQVKGAPAAEPYRCLGAAHARRGEWDDAESAFLSARDAAAADNLVLRAELGAMAGNAALASQHPDRALAALDFAHGEAQGAGDVKLAGEIAIDRARALVALKRNDEAAQALIEARTSTPDNPLAWLLSATLSRRQGKLAQAQAQISTAAQLQPTDPEIGLEAGLIAVLAGHDEAARKSWQSVVAAAPDSEAAGTARGYLAQLSPPAP